MEEPKLPATKTLSPDGTITIMPEDIVSVAVVRTPNEKFTGVRNRIKFAEGMARLPEPKKEDYNTDTLWLSDHQVWTTTIQNFRNSGYTVTVQKIALMGDETSGISLD